MSTYESDIKKYELERQISDASSYRSTAKSTRKSSEDSNSSIASARSAKSDVSRYSSASFMSPSGELLPSRHTVDGTPKPVLRRTCTDLQDDAGLEPLVLEWNRAINATLRRISPVEVSIYNRYVADGIGSHFKTGDLANRYATFLRQPPAHFMIDFNVKTSKGLLHRSVRLSHCSVVSNHGDPVLGLLSRMQAGLEDSADGYAIPFPARCTLSKAFFDHGLREKRASSGTLQVNLAVADPTKTVKRAHLGGMHYPFGVTEEQRRAFVKDYWYIKALLPTAKNGRTNTPTTVYLSKLEHRDAFPDVLKVKATEGDIQKWLGPKDPSGSYLINFEVNDIQMNMLGEIISAKLRRVSGPFVPVLACDMQAAQPVKKTGRFRR